jgi:hypothetical protein
LRQIKKYDSPPSKINLMLPASKCSPFCSAFLIALALLELDNFDTHVILKLPVHGRSIAQLEKDF